MVTLVAAIAAGEPVPDRPLVMECRRFGRDERALLDWPYKLISDKALGTFELYDLVADSGERRNLVEAKAERFLQMLGLLGTTEQGSATSTSLQGR